MPLPGQCASLRCTDEQEAMKEVKKVTTTKVQGDASAAWSFGQESWSTYFFTQETHFSWVFMWDVRNTLMNESQGTYSCETSILMGETKHNPVNQPR